MKNPVLFVLVLLVRICTAQNNSFDQTLHFINSKLVDLSCNYYQYEISPDEGKKASQCVNTIQYRDSVVIGKDGELSIYARKKVTVRCDENKKTRTEHYLYVVTFHAADVDFITDSAIRKGSYKDVEFGDTTYTCYALPTISIIIHSKQGKAIFRNDWYADDKESLYQTAYNIPFSDDTETLIIHYDRDNDFALMKAFKDLQLEIEENPGLHQ